MPKNRMTFRDPEGAVPPVTIEALKDESLRFTQIDQEGRANVVILSSRHAISRDVIVGPGARSHDLPEERLADCGGNALDAVGQRSRRNA